MLTNKRLILAHFWLAFAVFGAARGARRLADVRPQPAATPGTSIRNSITARLPRTARPWATCFRP